MSLRSDVPPDTLGVSLEPEGIEVAYSDGRRVFYHGVPEKTEGSLLTPPGKEVHVLVTDPTETEGVLLYINDRKTSDDILRDSGVGRVLVPDGDSESLFPGVEVENRGLRVQVHADHEAIRGRVFVFIEDELSEQSYEIVPDTTDERDGADPTERGTTSPDQDGHRGEE